MNITLKQMRVFVAVARVENVSRAATELHLTQSAVSMALRELESQLGRALFDRAGKRLLINANGAWLFPKALAMLEQVHDIAVQMGQADRQHLAIGGSTTIADCLFPKLARYLYETEPTLDLQLESGNSDAILALLLARNIDIGLVEGICQHPQVNATPWWNDRLVVIAHPSHPLARRAAHGPLPVEALVGSTWILRERGSGTRAIFEHALRGHISDFTLRSELKHLPTIKALVSSGNAWLSCLSEISVAAEIKAGDLTTIAIEGISLERQFYMLEHKQAYRSSLVSGIIHWIDNVAVNKTI